MFFADRVEMKSSSGVRIDQFLEGGLDLCFAEGHGVTGLCGFWRGASVTKSLRRNTIPAQRPYPLC